MNIRLSNNILRCNSNRTLFLGSLLNWWSLFFLNIDCKAACITSFKDDLCLQRKTLYFQSVYQWNHFKFNFLLYICSLGCPQIKEPWTVLPSFSRDHYPMYDLRIFKPKCLCILPPTSIWSACCSKFWRQFYYWTILY